MRADHLQTGLTQGLVTIFLLCSRCFGMSSFGPSSPELSPLSMTPVSAAESESLDTVEPGRLPTCAVPESVCSSIFVASGNASPLEVNTVTSTCACADGTNCPVEPHNGAVLVDTRTWYGLCRKPETIQRCNAGENFMTISLVVSGYGAEVTDKKFMCLCTDGHFMSTSPRTIIDEQREDGSILRQIYLQCDDTPGKRGPGMRSFYKREAADVELPHIMNTFHNSGSGSHAEKRDVFGISAFYKKSFDLRQTSLNKQPPQGVQNNFNSQGSEPVTKQHRIDKRSIDTEDDDFEGNKGGADEAGAFHNKFLFLDSPNTYYKRPFGLNKQSSFYKRGNQGLGQSYDMDEGVSLRSLGLLKRSNEISSFYKRVPVGVPSMLTDSQTEEYDLTDGLTKRGLSSFYKRIPNGMPNILKRRGNGISSFYKRGMDGTNSFYKRYPNSKISSFYKRASPSHLSSFYKRFRSSGVSSFYKRSPFSDTSSFYKRSPLSGLSRFYKRSPASSMSSFYKRSPSSGISSFYKRSPVTNENRFYKRSPQSNVSSFYKRLPQSNVSSFYKRSPQSNVSSFYKRSPHSNVNSFYKRSPQSNVSSFYKRSP